MVKINQLEIEREKLHALIESGSSQEEIVKQSEILDQHILNCYLKESGGE